VRPWPSLLTSAMLGMRRARTCQSHGRRSGPLLLRHLKLHIESRACAALADFTRDRREQVTTATRLKSTMRSASDCVVD
jgi:hypothetical protein